VAARLIILLRLLIVIAQRRRHVARVVVVLLLLLLIGLLPLIRLLLLVSLLLLIGLRVIGAARARRRIELTVRAAVGGIDVAIIRSGLWCRLLAGIEPRLWRQHHRLAGGGSILILIVGGLCRSGSAAGDGVARVAGQRDRGRAGQRHSGAEHALLLYQR